MSYKLIGIDMDGTLLNSKKEISPKDLEAIKTALDQNYHVVLSTGRAPAELKIYPELLDLLHYGILESGALLYDFKEKKALFKKCIDPIYEEKILEAAEYEKIEFQVLSEVGMFLSRDFIDHIEDYHQSVYLSLYKEVATIVPDLITTIRELKGYEKINLFHTSPESRLHTYERLKDLPLAFAFSETASLEITPLNINKGEGLKRLSEHLNIPITETIALGDADNDKDMFMKAGLSIAMGNALDEIKNACDVCVQDNDNNGVKEAIERYLMK